MENVPVVTIGNVPNAAVKQLQECIFRSNNASCRSKGIKTTKIIQYPQNEYQMLSLHFIIFIQKIAFEN